MFSKNKIILDANIILLLHYYFYLTPNYCYFADRNVNTYHEHLQTFLRINITKKSHYLY